MTCIIRTPTLFKGSWALEKYWKEFRSIRQFNHVDQPPGSTRHSGYSCENRHVVSSEHFSSELRWATVYSQSHVTVLFLRVFLCRVLPIMKVISCDNSPFMKLIFPHLNASIYDICVFVNIISALLLCFIAQILNNLFKVTLSKIVWQCVTVSVT